MTGCKTKIENPRERLLFDFGWKFQLGDPADVDSTLNYAEVEHLDKTWPEEINQEIKLGEERVDPVKVQPGVKLSYVQTGFDDKDWAAINLPHDWAVELPYDSLNTEGMHIGHGFKAIGDKRYGNNNIGWYRRSFDIPASDKGKSIQIEFDGVYRNCLVWLNGHCLGRNVSGYLGFMFDVSKYLNYGGKNTLAVRVDASRFEGWWYEGAGIYRHVWLVKSNTLHVAYWGTYVSPKVVGENAETDIQTEIRNDGEASDTCSLISTIVDARGQTVSESRRDQLIVPPSKTFVARQQLVVENAKLWSLENPYLYKVVSTIIKSNVVVDRYETPFGIRTIKFDKDSGFYLNGKHVLLKGVCIHQDHAGVGTAIPDRLQRYRIEKLKEMGCNAYRTSHNPPTPELLQICDELGILVMDETRRFSTDPNGKGQLERLIRRDRNHPSIILWSIGNEEMETQKLEISRKIITELQDFAHLLDPTRQVTLAVNDSAWGYPASQTIEIMGYNYLQNGNMDDFHKAYPNKPSVGSEEASSHSTRGIYRIDSVRLFGSSYLPLMRYWSSTPEYWLQYYAKRPWVAGAFIWTGIDYRGEPLFRRWPSTGSCYGGMDRCCFPKDPYYCYQASGTSKPVL
ncbi:MAG: glycoside hydrolase family 2 TIM barrel-domain containing protein, partial [Bacteroidales bacterium]|nr:glycoside hydrolase family 2 TIM barrel-domain containing protein [Bacteroidales bacterium]